MKTLKFIEIQRALILLIPLFFILSSALVYSEEQAKEVSKVLNQEIGIFENLGTTLDLTLPIKLENGQIATLSKIINGTKPVILSLVYYSCPGLCNLHLNGLTEALSGLDWNVGNQFDVIALSFEPLDTSEVGLKKKENYIKIYGRQETASGWHFLTAENSVIKAITSQVGFRYKWDSDLKEWAHSSAAIIISPKGVVSRYLHGVEFKPKDIKLALMDAAQGKVGGAAEQLIWYCYGYSSKTNKYEIIIARVLQLGGGILLLILMILLLPFWVRSKKKK